MKHILKKFRHWLYYSPPGALSTTGWKLFDKEFKKVAPVRYWITRSFIRKFLRRVQYMINNISAWVRHRTTVRRHVINTRLKPGYHDISALMLHANFSLLVDHVEVDQAWHSYTYDHVARSTLSRSHMWWARLPFYRTLVPFREPTLGIAYLNWASGLDDPALTPAEQSPRQAVVARETLALYNWWVSIRPNRKKIEIPSYATQGTLDDPIESFDRRFDENSSDYKKFKAALDEQDAADKNWDDEDTAMLTRLIAIRNDLWV